MCNQKVVGLYIQLWIYIYQPVALIRPILDVWDYCMDFAQTKLILDDTNAITPAQGKW
jgi:hypothetical protein